VIIAQIFTAIQLLLKLFGLWEAFSQWTVDKAIADRNERKQERDKAVDAEQNAQTEQEFNDAQDKLTRNLPRP
jgi:hypothetical protein